MNADILRGKWTQIKGQVKQRWAKLTDDDIKYMEGNLQNAAGRLQERYGIAREQAEREWEQFVDSATATNPAAGNQAAGNQAAGRRQDNPTGASAGRPVNPNPNLQRSGKPDENEEENEQGV